MSKLVAALPDNSTVEFDRGSFDDWCVYLKQPELSRYAPKDTQYFTILKELGSIYGNQKIYDDFVKIYNITTSQIDSNVIKTIIEISSNYCKNQDKSHKDEICRWFTVVYAGMVAEENKQNAVLKKRIKRLGIHQVLIEGLKPIYAADFSRGKKWRELDAICREKGF